MDRRRFLRSSALGGTAAGLGMPALASGKRTLNMVTTWDRGLPGVHDAAQRVADSITQMTDGALTVKLHALGEMVGGFEVFQAVTSGQADMYHAADYFFVAQHPGFAFFTAIPFGMTAAELSTWYDHQGGRDLHDALGRLFGLKSFLAGNTGPHAGGWFKTEIRAPEDFAGKKLRMPGLSGQVLRRLGAEIVSIPGAEVPVALASGALDGTEWNGPWLDEIAKFHEQELFYYPAGFHEPAAGLSLALNRDVYDSLSAPHKKVVEIAAGECHRWSLGQFTAHNGAALSRLVAEGARIRVFSDPVWDALGAAAAEVIQENMHDVLYEQIHDSAMAAMRGSTHWLSVSEGAYRRQRDRILG